MRHSTTLLETVCKLKLKNCLFLEFSHQYLWIRVWTQVTGTIEKVKTKGGCDGVLSQRSDLSRARFGPVES